MAKGMSSPQRRKTSKGAHGGGVPYDAMKNDTKFESHSWLKDNKKEPADKQTPALNKDAGYNE